MNTVKGYVIIKRNAECKFAMGKPSDWQGKTLRAMELNDRTDGALVVSNDAQKMASFDYSDIERMFHCDEEMNVLMPPHLDILEKMVYSTLVTTRNGGYNNMCREMVKMASLHREEFCDSVLWQKGQDPDTVAQIDHFKKLSKERGEKKQKMWEQQVETLKKAKNAHESTKNTKKTSGK
jgi:hypothetical protein